MHSSRLFAVTLGALALGLSARTAELPAASSGPVPPGQAPER